MRIYFVLLLAVAAVSNIAAVTVDIPRDLSASFRDGEASADVALPVGRLDDLRVFKIRLQFNSNLSNNVQVAFGIDGAHVAKDGALSLEETKFIIGWDGGWFIRANKLKDRFVFVPQDFQVSRERTLTARIRVAPEGAVQSVIFTQDNEEFEFDGLGAEVAKSVFDPKLLTDLRVTIRNGNESEKISALYMKDAAIIIVR